MWTLCHLTIPHNTNKKSVRSEDSSKLSVQYHWSSYFLETATNPLLCFYILSWGKNSSIIHRLSQRYVKGIMCKRWKIWENTFWHFCIKASKILEMKNLAAFISHRGKITFYLFMWRHHWHFVTRTKCDSPVLGISIKLTCDESIVQL